MLVSIHIKNFRSIAQMAGLSFVGIESEKGKPEHLIAIPGSKLSCLRTGVVYGANAAGKSNVCKALSFLKGLVLDSHPTARGTGREVFAFSKHGLGPTDFDIRFISQGHLFRYFISVDDVAILREVLMDETEGEARILFERTKREGDEVSSVEFPDASGMATTRKMRSLVTVGIASAQSFLSAMRMLIKNEEDRLWANPVIEWFQRLCILSPDSVFAHLERVVDDSELNEYVGRMMSVCATGIRKINVHESVITETDYLEARRLLTKAELERMEDEDWTRFVLRKGDDVVVYEKSTVKTTRTVIRASHGSRNNESLGDLPLNQESDGTRRLFNLLPALYVLERDDRVYVIDEIDRSLHPLLTREFIRTFLSNVSRGQLLMTTHDNNLLDADLFRRDEVWFAEKDSAQATHFFSLAEFRPRIQKSQGDYYLEGRFGAIPIFRNCRTLDLGGV